MIISISLPANAQEEPTAADAYEQISTTVQEETTSQPQTTEQTKPKGKTGRTRTKSGKRKYYINGGDCHSDASAFAYLAAAIGYKNVYACNDSDGYGGYMNGHAWAEVDGRVYDTLFAEAKGFNKYYNVSYKSYELRPILHYCVDYDEKTKP